MLDEVASCATVEASTEARTIAPAHLPWTSKIPWPVRRLLTQGIKKTALRPIFLRTLGHPDHATRSPARQSA
jgi:hypothetical protein